MTQPITHPLPRLAGPLTICLLALAMLWRPLLAGDVFLPLDALLHMHPWRYSYERVPVNNHVSTDPIRQIYPRRVLANAMLAQGELPLWNPALLSGTPLMDDGQLALFYPPSALYLLLPIERAHAWYAWLQLALAGLGVYALARRLGLSRPAATLGGALYMFSGYMLTWLQFPHHSGAAAMLPWAFWAAERAIQRRSLWSWALAGLPLAMMVLTHVQLTLYGLAGVGGYTLLRTLQGGTARTRLRDLGGVALATGLALALGAVQLLPAAVLSSQGQRADIGLALAPPEEYMGNLLRLISPPLGGWERVGAPPAWGPATLQVPYPYVGLATLLLAAAALALSRVRQTWIFGLLAAGAFALALRTPLLLAFTTLLPPYRQFEDHRRWFVLWCMAAAVLAAIGADAIRERVAAAGASRRAGSAERAPRDRSVLAARGLLAALALIVGGWALVHLQLFTPQSRYGQYITLLRSEPLTPVLVFGLASLGATALLLVRRLPPALAFAPLIAVAVLDVWWYGAGYSTSVSPAVARPTTDLTRDLQQYPRELQLFHTVFPPTRQVAFLQSQPGPFRILGADYDTMPPNLASAYGLEDVRGYQSLYTARYNRLARLIDGKDYSRTSEGFMSLRAFLTSAYERRRMLDMLNVEYLVFAPGSTTAERYADLELVSESDEGRIYRNTRALPRAWLVHRAEVIADDDAQLDRMARPDFDPAALAILPEPAPELAPAAGPEATPTVTTRANGMTIRASASAPALLVLSEMYYDGWEARVDGAPAPIYRANYALRAVWLPAGEHTVELVYRPLPLALGGALSAATLLGLAGAAAWRRRSAAPARRAPLSVAKVTP